MHNIQKLFLSYDNRAVDLYEIVFFLDLLHKLCFRFHQFVRNCISKRSVALVLGTLNGLYGFRHLACNSFRVVYLLVEEDDNISGSYYRRFNHFLFGTVIQR